MTAFRDRKQAKKFYNPETSLFFGSALFSVDMICLAELYVKDFVSIPPDTINFAAPEGLPAGDSVTNQYSPEELRSYQPIQNNEEAFFLNFFKRSGCIDTS